jgi:oligoribonuclease NrnB/cAMP/cGMP phosphodiesterase (DHH superfamily)
MNKVKILYHASCMDGTGSKYAAWKKFGENADYYPCQYGQPLPDLEGDRDSELFLLDFSVSRTELETLRRVYKRVVVVDHHQTAREALEGLEDVVFNMDKSGAVLAWEYFHPDDPVPMLLQYIQDRDLWKFKLEGTEAIHAGLGTLRGRMDVWNKYAEHSDGPHQLLAKGQILLDRDKDVVKNQVPQNVRVADFMGYRAGFLNNGALVSEMGHAMYSDETLNVDIGVCWFVMKDNTVVMSMRSAQDGGPDVSKLCKQFNGGGHKNSAGCRTDLDTMKLILEGKLSQPI